MTTEIPRLSPSIAKILLQKSPLHAWNAHRLLGGKSSKPSAAQVKGKVVDALVFSGMPVTTAEPMSDKVRAECEAIAAAVKDALQARGISGTPQYRVEWTNATGANCSGYIDLANPDNGRFWELKTCHDLSDWNIVKQIEQYGYDVQYAAYAEAMHSKFPDLACIGEFIFVETTEPYDVRFVSLTSQMKRNGNNLWLSACKIWNQCMSTDVWPGRGDLVADVSPYRKKQEVEDWINT